MSKREGSITVFLSLVGLLIFALLGTLVETARYTVCKNHVARTTQTATEGLLTEYSRPLYEQYRLFFIESEGTPYENVIAGYVGDTMEASRKKPHSIISNKDFLAGHLTNVEVTHKTYLGDNQAKALQQEITDYMGRQVTKEGLEHLFNNTSKLQTIEKDAKKIEERVEREKKEAKLDEELLSLMQLVDGISVSHGKVSCADEFVKCFAVKGIKGQDFSVTEGVVWKKMREHIDHRTKTWNISDKRSFLSKLAKVKSLITQAIHVGERLENGYHEIGIPKDDASDMIKKIISALPCLQTNKRIVEKTEEMLKDKSIDECRDELVEIWKNYDTTSLSFDYTGVQEHGGGDNPKDSFATAWNKGILSLVCKDPDALSKKSVSNPDSYAKLYEEENEKKEYDNRISNFTSNDTVELSGVLGDMGDYAMDEFCLDQYIQKKFGSYIHKLSGWKQALDYGLEYVVAGEGSDLGNLKNVLNRILLVRSVVNFTAIYKDSAKQAEAEAAALAVVGFTGLQPLIALVRTLILLTWSLVESLVDLAGLLMERHVPILKSSPEIKTTFPEIFVVTHDAIINRASTFAQSKKSSFGYREYLLMFLACTKQSTRLYRVMDLIEHNMRKNGYEGFRLGTCVHDIKVKTTMNFDAKLFHFSIIEKILGRDLQNYSITKEVIAGY